MDDLPREEMSVPPGFFQDVGLDFGGPFSYNFPETETKKA